MPVARHPRPARRTRSMLFAVARLGLTLLTAGLPALARADAPGAIPVAIPVGAAADTAGYDGLDLELSHRARPVAASLWYPVGTPTYRGLVGDNAAFKGVPAFVGAAPGDGPWPLLLLSHGSGGNMDNLAWLSSALALSGVMVLAVNHPGSTSGDSSPRRSLDLGARAKDISGALDAILADPVFGRRVDRSRIAVLGFSLGGSTALQLAGARLDRARYADYCDRFTRAADCVFFRKGGVDLGGLPASFEADVADPRIRAAIAVDPGMTYGFTPASVAAMRLPVLLISLAPPADWTGFDAGRATDLGPEGSGLAASLPRAEHAVIGPAIHFTFLGLCKPEGEALLAAEEDDAVCTDPAATDRAAVHDRIARRVLDFLARRL